MTQAEIAGTEVIFKTVVAAINFINDKKKGHESQVE